MKVKVCEVCCHVAWAPVGKETECELLHPHRGEHFRCDYCWLADRFRQLFKSVEKVLATSCPESDNCALFEAVTDLRRSSSLRPGEAYCGEWRPDGGAV